MAGIRRGAKPEWERTSTLAPLVRRVAATVAPQADPQLGADLDALSAELGDTNTAVDGLATTLATKADASTVAMKAPLAAPALTGAAMLDGQALVRASDPRLTDPRTPAAHGHPLGDVTGLVTALAGKADTAGLTTVLAGKSDTAHTHAAETSSLALAAIGFNVVRVGTGEGVVLTAQVPAGMVVGSTFLVRASGVITVAGKHTVRVRVGATGTTADTQAWIPSSAPTGVLNTVVHGEWLLTVKSTIRVAVEGLLVNSVTNVTRAAGAPALFTINAALPWFITLTSAMSTTGGTLTWTTGYIERRF